MPLSLLTLSHRFLLNLRASSFVQRNQETQTPPRSTLFFHYKIRAHTSSKTVSPANSRRISVRVSRVALCSN